MNVKLLLVWILTLVLATAADGPAFAWNKRGHEVVAELAYERLTPEQRREVDGLIQEGMRQDTPKCPVTTLAQASNWADCIRKKERGIKQKLRVRHTMRLPICGDYEVRRYCRDGRCASTDIERYAAILADRNAPVVDRLHALEVVLHVVGDIHQPMHVVPRRGGDALKVALLDSEPQSLHEFWDKTLVAAALPKDENTMAQLRELIAANETKWSGGDPFSWAIEANAVARRFAIPRNPLCGAPPGDGTIRLDASYRDKAVDAVRAQVAAAGVRLSIVLAHALGR